MSVYARAARVERRLGYETGLAFPELVTRLLHVHAQTDWIAVRAPGEGALWLSTLRTMRARSRYRVSFINPRLGGEP